MEIRLNNYFFSFLIVVKVFGDIKIGLFIPKFKSTLGTVYSKACQIKKKIPKN